MTRSESMSSPWPNRPKPGSPKNGEPGLTVIPRLVGPQLHDVLGAGTSALRTALERLSLDAADFEALDAVFDVTRAALRAAELGFGAPVGGGKDEAEAGLTTEQLEAAVAAIERVAAPPDLTLAEVAREETSILIELLIHSSDLASHERAMARLDALRRAELEVIADGHTIDPKQAIAGVLVEAIVDLAESLSIEQFDTVYGHLAPRFRRFVQPVLEHLPNLAGRLTDKGREALWPHAVDEFLIHIKGRRVGLDPRLDLPAGPARTRALGRLIGLPAIAESRLDPGAFTLDQTFLHALLMELLDERGARTVVGPALLSALKRTPPSEPWLANVLRAADKFTFEIEPFVRTAIAQFWYGKVDESLMQTAAKHLLRALSALAPEERELPWVVGALTWIGEHGELPAFDFLEKVINERKMLRHTWNKECRRAAQLGIERGWGER